MQKKSKYSKETILKFKEIALTRDNTNRIKSLPRRENHWNWSEKPTKLALHKRIHRQHGKASDRKCIECGNRARDWSNETGKYTDKIEDYVPRCRKCHTRKDENWKKNKSENWKKLSRDSKGRFLKRKTCM